MMKLLSIVLRMMIFFVPSGSFADNSSADHNAGESALSSGNVYQRNAGSCTNKACSGSSEPVAVDHQGWWLTGILVGRVDSREWVDGIVWGSGELEILTSNGSQSSHYPSFQYLLSVEEQASELWQSLMAMRDSQNLIFAYRSQDFWSSPFISESHLILTSIASSVESFFDSRSYKEFPEGVDVGWDYRNTWFFQERVSRGLITRVQRAGQSHLA